MWELPAPLSSGRRGAELQQVRPDAEYGRPGDGPTVEMAGMHVVEREGRHMTQHKSNREAAVMTRYEAEDKAHALGHKLSPWTTEKNTTVTQSVARCVIPACGAMVFVFVDGPRQSQWYPGSAVRHECGQ